jgi:Cu(I)/Ag(I) efflux system protein CusF
MKSFYLLAPIASAVLLSACGQKAETTVKEQPAATSAPADMGNMAMPADTKMGKGTGTVTAIDKVAGKITLDHGPIPEVGWPAMTMAFKASPDLLNSVAVGDKVAFDLTLKGNAGEVTAISKQ